MKALGEYVVASAPTGAAMLAADLGAEVLIVRAPVPEAYFAQAKGLRAAVRHGAGLDMIPVAAATAAGLLVANVPGANAGTVAEHAIFAAIALRRQFRAMDGALRTRGWAAGRAFSDHGRELSGAVIGILGMGAIGQRLAAMAQAMGIGGITPAQKLKLAA